MFTHRLSQAVWFGGQQVKQEPSEQIWFLPHTLPQAPQFRRSDDSSTQAPSHSVCPSGQTGTHVPHEQEIPVPQTFPHAPQLSGSER